MKMKIMLSAAGMLAKFLGESPIPLELADGATLRDLLDRFDRDLAGRIPGYLWNRDEKRFRGPVVITADDKVITDPAELLKNGWDIRIYKAFVGG